MKINRTMTIETNEIQIGDRIQVGHYTATCQALPGEGLALFLLDQYLDKAMQMNEKNTNKGGYQESDLREELNSEKILKDFTSLELAPFDNGDLLRLPFYGEMFGHDDWYNSGAVEPDDCEQWPLIFQSTSSVWRTTTGDIKRSAHGDISIHVLRVEDDCKNREKSLFAFI